jgi:hypothetical protein
MSSPELLALRSAFESMKRALAANDLAAIEATTTDFHVLLERMNSTDVVRPGDLSLVRELHEASDAIVHDLASRLRAFDVVIDAWRDAERDRDEPVD